MTLKCTWKRYIQIMSQSIRNEFKNKLKVHKFVEGNRRLPSTIKESCIDVTT